MKNPLESMNNSDASNNIPYEDWQIVAEFELSVGPSTDEAIQTWLIKSLDPLELHAHFLTTILNSAQEAVKHAMKSERAAEFGHLHFRLYAPRQFVTNGQTWGFFQIEKMGTSTEHAIEFYLYPEG